MSILFGAMNHPGKPAKDEVLSIAADGFDYCDFTYEGPGGIITIAQAKEMRQFVCTQMGYSNFSFLGHTFFDLKYASEFPSTFDGSVEVFKDAINLLSYLNAPTITIHYDYGTPFIEEKVLIESHVRLFETLYEYMKKAHIPMKLVMENSPIGKDQVKNFKTIFEYAPYVGLHLDIAHALITGGMDEVANFLEMGQNNRLLHVHISDNNGKADEHLPIGVPHKTRHPWPEIMKLVKKSGYGTGSHNRTITLEIFSEDHWNRIHSLDIIRELWEKA